MRIERVKMTDKIYIGIDNKRIELKGKELETFLEQRAKDQADYEAEQSRIEAEQLAKEELKASALAKLAALGLTEDEAKTIMGVN